MDIKSVEARSKNMASIKGRDTKPETALRQALWRRGVRFFTSQGWRRLSGTRLTGSPDLIFPAVRVVLFVDGCFWHGCPNHYHAPAQHSGFWADKLRQNQKRDENVTRVLAGEGWHVVRIWEHELKACNIGTAVDSLLVLIQGLRNAGH